MTRTRIIAVCAAAVALVALSGWAGTHAASRVAEPLPNPLTRVAEPLPNPLTRLAEPLPNPWHVVVVAEPLPNPYHPAVVG